LKKSCARFAITIDNEVSLWADLGAYTSITCPVPAGTRIEMLDTQELRAAGKCKFIRPRQYDERGPEGTRAGSGGAPFRLS
jgi:hypothetical protein